jgi:hypothetical protein
METPVKLLFPFFTVNGKVSSYFVEDNTDFLVVGCVGMKSVGKSTILNILAGKERQFCEDGVFQVGQDFMEGE